MKIAGNELTGDQKLELAKESITLTLERLGFQVNVIGDFLNTIKKSKEDTLKLLKGIPEGINTWGGNYWGPTGQTVHGIEVWGVNPRVELRSKMMLWESLVEHVGFVFSFYRSCRSDEEQPTLSSSFVHKKENSEKLEIIQVCFLQILAGSNQIEQRHFNYFRETVGIMRRHLEVIRVQLRLSGQSSYRPEIKNADIFLTILEKRVSMWNSSKKPRKANSRKAQ